MNTIQKKIVVFFSLFFIGFTFGQTIMGEVIYKGTLNPKYTDSIIKDMASKDIPMSHKKFSIDAYNNALDIELILKFKDNTSFYYYNPSLEIEDNYNTTKGMVSTMSYFTDNSTNKIIEINKYVGNILHESLNWQVTKKTKKIGKYECYQAIATEELYSRKGFFYKEKVIAWFTPEIPLNFGPKYYKDLPGLILEIQKKKFSIVATRIILSPSKEITFKIPKIKNVISKKESYRRYKEMIDNRKSN